MKKSVTLFVSALTLMAAVLSSQAVAGKDPVYTGFFGDLAIKGYDAVAYFTENAAKTGSDAFEYEWNGATWRFSSPDNLAKFKSAPQKYAPQYGGYCAWAVANNKLASADPHQFHLHDGKLYLNYDADIQVKWLADRDNLITAADKNWPAVLD